MKKQTLRYSESFKLQVVGELESGRFETIGQAQSHYGIRGAQTVHGWVKKLGKNHLLPKVVRVESPEERNELKRLQERIRQLESALADAHLDREIEKSYLQIACKKAGIDMAELKKKSDGSAPSSRRNGSRGRSR